MRRMGIVKKIVLLIIVLLVITATAIILLNRYFYQRDMRQQLQRVQLPLISDKVLAEVDATIQEPARGVMLLVNNPFFRDWITAGEPADSVDTVFQMLDSMRENYGILTVNFASAASLNYYAASGDGHNTIVMDDLASDAWSWFPTFRDSNAPASPTSTSTIRSGAPPPTRTSASTSAAHSPALSPPASASRPWRSGWTK